MKPTIYRGASAIMLFNKESSILMDCAECSYTQIFDHFGTKARCDQILVKLRCLYITHLHGDHQYGTFKILKERDDVIRRLDPENRTKLYVVVPATLLPQLELFLEQGHLHCPQMVELINSCSTNPETQYYYQDDSVREGSSL
jgi:ribonuclease BN (tRNA processing enzyme)